MSGPGEKNIHWVKKRCIVSFCSITAITRCELRLAAKLRNQNIIAEEVGKIAKSRGAKKKLATASDADQGGTKIDLEKAS